MLQYIFPYSSQILFSLYRFVCWYPAFLVGIAVWIAGYCVSTPPSTLPVISPIAYLGAISIEAICLFLTLFFIGVRIVQGVFSPVNRTLFHASWISLVLVTYIILPHVQNGLLLGSLATEYGDHIAIKNARIGAVLQNRSLGELYGKPMWKLAGTLQKISFPPSFHNVYATHIEKILLGIPIQIKSQPPCPLTCGAIFECDADINIIRDEEKGIWRVAIKPYWNSLQHVSDSPVYAVLGEMKLTIDHMLHTRSFLLYPEDSRVREVLFSLLFGFPLEKETKVDIHRAGVDHLFAISGFHFSCVSGLSALLLFALSHRVRAGVSLFAAAIFLCIVGFQAPSVLRSWWMILLASLGALLRLRSSPLNSFGVALCLVSFLDPSSVSSVGFHLSFLATWGLLLYSGPLSDFFSRYIFVRRQRHLIEEMSQGDQVLYLILRIFSGGVSLALSVWLFIIPYSFSFLDGFSMLGIFYNLVLPPIFSLALLSGVISLLCSLVSISLASCVAFATRGFVMVGLFMIDVTQGVFLTLPYSALSLVSTPGLFFIMFSSLSVLGIVWHVSWRERKSRSSIPDGDDMPLDYWKGYT